MFTPHQHVDVRLSQHEWVEVHTYDDPSGLALIDAYGSSTDGNDGGISFWLTEAEIRQIRDALNKALGESA